MRIGLAVIATGKYVEFLPRLGESVDRFFLGGRDVEMLVFSDTIPSPPIGKSGFFAAINHEPWPGPTIHRYRELSGWQFRRFDYIFLCDADMEFVAPVGDEILGDLVATIHPGFWNKPRSKFTYENRPDSAACIGPDQGLRYYAGGFQGGRADRYLDACRTIASRIAQDEKNSITAVWHDESHWNRYLVENPPDVELDPGYCYPESWDLPFTPRLLALDKNHAEMRA